jgi:hypothetical protein
MIKITTVFLLSLTALLSRGQDSAITWHAGSIRDLRSNEESPISCEFRIYTNRIEWIQSNSSESFSRSSTDGQFPQQGVATITYNVVREGIPGKITIERTEAGEVTLTLDLREGTQLGAYYSFKVTIE